MTSNSANWGGVVAAGSGVVVGSNTVGGNTNRTAAFCSTASLANCVMTSNFASLSGGSIIVREGGTADLMKSVFQSNLGGANDTDDGVGIVNLNGQVKCDAAVGCLPVCTVCHDEDGPSLPPTPQPTMQNNKRKTGGSGTVVVSLVVGFLLCLFGSLVGLCCTFKFGRGQSPGDEDSGGFEVQALRLPLMDNPEQPSGTTTVRIDGSATEQHGRANNNTTMTPSSDEDNEQPENLASLPWSAIGSSPSPIFVIDREMRIKSWSPGACVTHGVVMRFPGRITRLIESAIRCCHTNRDVGLCPVDHGTNRSFSWHASLRAHTCEKRIPQLYSPGFRRHDR
jgi:hypothetical protein